VEAGTGGLSRTDRTSAIHVARMPVRLSSCCFPVNNHRSFLGLMSRRVVHFGHIGRRIELAGELGNTPAGGFDHGTLGKRKPAQVGEVDWTPTGRPLLITWRRF
jgi:hypothetical protein